MTDVYAKVTEAIIAAIEAGAGEWRMPWHAGRNGSGMVAAAPINAASRKQYRGINTLVLWAAASTKGYESNEWATYRQWSEKGAQVRKGEKSTTVVFWRFPERSTEAQEGDDTPTPRRGVFARAYSVFNAAQVDGYTPRATVDTPALPEPSPLARIEEADAFFEAIGGDVHYGGNRAFYRPGTDSIHMPHFDQFVDAVSFYGTLAHEYTHWTGDGARCKRDLSGRFGSESYAAEELIAELGAAFTLATLGLATEPREDHAQYIQNWLKVLRSDNRAIFTAASHAQKATDWLLEKAGYNAAEADETAAVAA